MKLVQAVVFAAFAFSPAPISTALAACCDPADPRVFPYLIAGTTDE